MRHLLRRSHRRQNGGERTQQRIAALLPRRQAGLKVLGGFDMELLIPPRHREQFSVLRDSLPTEQAKVGPVTWNGYLRVQTSDQVLIDVLKEELDAQPAVVG